MDEGKWCTENAREIQKLARSVHRRWRIPSAVSVEDVEQEIRLGVVIALRKFDPSRGVPLDRYVGWCAIQHAKRWVHVQRGARRRSGSSPSEYPLGEAVTGFDPDVREDERTTAEAVAEFMELLRHALAACRTAQERAGVDALVDAQFDAEVASTSLHAAEWAPSPRQARRVVRRCMMRIQEVQHGG